jgi:lipopolysaccharide transport system permease protein
MGIALSSSALSLRNLLLLEPTEGEREWRKWRAGADLETLDGDCLPSIQLLSGRLPKWMAEDPNRDRLLGICKRGWAQNQLRYRELAAVWMLLQQAGAAPIAIGGCAAWALLYWEEKAVRAIASFDIFIPREGALMAVRCLESAGWIPEPGMPVPEGRALDRFEGVWFRSPANDALFLRWRLAKVSPELAGANQFIPACAPVEIQGASIPVLRAEELLLDALSRDGDMPVSWKCDAIVLLRNRRVDWKRLFDIARDVPLAAERLTTLRNEGISIPAFSPGRRSQFRVDYQQFCWAHDQPVSRLGFAGYLLKRGLRLKTAAPSLTIIDASAEGGGSTLAEYRRYRTLFLFLTMRDIRLRYRKTWRGILWAIVQPLLPMLIFGAIFSRVIRPELPRGPYWLFVLAGLAPWSFFAGAVNYSSVTFVNNFGLLNKIYFPRAILPVASVAACLLDLLVSSTFLIALSGWMGYAPRLEIFLLPGVVGAAAVVAACVGLAAASLNVRYRDLKPLVPFLVQVWMYSTPVLYPLAMLPPAYRRLPWINPMTGVVEAFRSALFSDPIDWSGEAISMAALLVIAAAAVVLFRKVDVDLAERL